jgi:hypothetical protein
MSERERWIVYPLLFLALGAALRDKLSDRTTTKSIVCQELTVVGDELVGRDAVRIIAKIGGTEGSSGRASSGYLVVNGQVDVNGAVNAQQYAYRGVPFTPALQAMFPSAADLIRSIEQSLRKRELAKVSADEETSTSDTEPAPPDTTPAEDDKTTTPSATPPAEPAATPAEPPLADPSGNR